MIKLDLRTDLAKLENFDLSKMGKCHYTAPCAVGAMMTEEQRNSLAEIDKDDRPIRSLIHDRFVEVPDTEQAYDLGFLQREFDRGTEEDFKTLLIELKEKYK